MENSNGAALVNSGERVQVTAIPARGWKFGDGKQEDKTLNVKGIFISSNDKVVKSVETMNCNGVLWLLALHHLTSLSTILHNIYDLVRGISPDVIFIHSNRTSKTIESTKYSTEQQWIIISGISW